MIRLLVCSFLMAPVWAYIAHSDRGMHFVVACPWSRDTRCCEILQTTDERFVTVRYRIGSREAILRRFARRETERFSLCRSGQKAKPQGVSSGQENIGAIWANGPVRVFVFVPAETPLFDVLRPPPEESCGKLYYLTTSAGSPFVIVMAFGRSKTKVEVDIPKLDDMKVLFCKNSESCSKEKAVVTLSKYQVWSINTDDVRFDMTGLKISADFPIYVISGNHDCTEWFPVCADSVRSPTTWGKTYVIPDVVEEKLFRFSSYKYPIRVKFQDNDREEPKDILTAATVVEFRFTIGLMVVTSNDPFGLYFILDGKLTSLIPTEQWPRGDTVPNIEGVMYTFKYFYVILTDSDISDVVLEGIDEDLDWTGVVVGGIKYFTTDFSYYDYAEDAFHANVYTKKTNGKLLVYGQPFKEKVYPVGHYFSEIYQDVCKPSTEFSPNDGVDNDCDGSIDEETENGLDDDGDGLVDEDFVDIFSDGSWTPWVWVCDVQCLGKTYALRTRECSGKSDLGRGCDGRDIKCNQEDCPTSCGESKDCFCQNATCPICSFNKFQCDFCPYGFAASVACTTTCPSGWAGLSCTDAVKYTRKFVDDDDDNGVTVAATNATNEGEDVDIPFTNNAPKTSGEEDERVKRKNRERDWKGDLMYFLSVPIILLPLLILLIVALCCRRSERSQRSQRSQPDVVESEGDEQPVVNVSIPPRTLSDIRKFGSEVD